MELFRQTFTIMVIGMTLVFFFLFVVIQCMNLIAFFVRRYEAKRDSDTPEAGDHSATQRHIAAAIAIATHPPSDKH